jgi:CRISPR-associated protein Csm1
MTRQVDEKIGGDIVRLGSILKYLRPFFDGGNGWIKTLVDGDTGMDWPGVKRWLTDDERLELVDILAEDSESFRHALVKESILLAGSDNGDRIQPPDRPLRVLFDHVSLPGIEENDSGSKGLYTYRPVPLSVDSVWPTLEQNDFQSAYQTHVAAFIQEFKMVVETNERVPEQILFYLLQKYLWCLPAPAYPEDFGVSLFQQMKISTAVASILRKQFSNSGEATDIAASKDRGEIRYSLILGDVSGIQDYIYNISSRGASRGLKGRSFYLQLLTDAASRFILERLSLTNFNLLFASGGKFYILAPQLADKEIRGFENAVNTFLFDKFSGKIHFSMGQSAFNGECLHGDFSSVWRDASINAERFNRNRFRHIMEMDYKNIFAPFGNSGSPTFCVVCGKDERDIDVSGDIRKCKTCLLSEEIGSKLKGYNYLGETIGEADGSDLEFQFNDFRISYKIYAEPPGTHHDGETIYRINNTDFLPEEAAGARRGFKFYGGPRAPQEDDGALKTFDELTQDSQGLKRLGILRMDVDNLGQLFRTGFGKERRTIAAMTAMSFYLDMFFQGAINRVMEPCVNSVQIIYSGGDDLFLTGAWDQTAQLALAIRDAFSAFTSNNSSLTLSAGFTMMGMKHPIARGADKAGEAEERSKNFRAAKDAVTFLDKTLSWHDFRICDEIKDMLMGIGDKRNAIINRLKLIHALYRKNAQELLGDEIETREVLEKIHYNKWQWRMVYSLARFVKANPEQEENINIIQKFLVSNTFERGNDSQTRTSEANGIDYINVPARWAEFLSRSEKEEGNDGR